MSIRGIEEPATKKRGSCLGCITRVTLALVFAMVVGLIVVAVTEPWAFFLGGKFQLYPSWQGFGKLHSSTSGDYVVFVRFTPWPGRYGTWLRGQGYMCTPRKEILSLKLTGSMPKHPNMNTDGQPISLRIRKRIWYYSLSGPRNPVLDFRGNWRNPNIVMNDQGSISRAFLPDGRVREKNNPKQPIQPTKPEVLPVTFIPGSYSNFEAACTAMHQ